MSLIEKKYKKLVKELLFAYSELEYTSEAVKDAHSDFEGYYQQYCIDNKIPLAELQKKNEEKLEKTFKREEQKTDEEGIIQFDKPEKTNDPVNKIFQKMYHDHAGFVLCLLLSFVFFGKKMLPDAQAPQSLCSCPATTPNHSASFFQNFYDLDSAAFFGKIQRFWNPSMIF